MPYETRIAIDPDVLKQLQERKADWGLQSHNKVLRRLLGLSDVRVRGNGKALR